MSVRVDSEVDKKNAGIRDWILVKFLEHGRAKEYKLGIVFPICIDI